jgi:hypothetical protein
MLSVGKHRSAAHLLQECSSLECFQNQLNPDSELNLSRTHKSKFWYYRKFGADRSVGVVPNYKMDARFSFPEIFFLSQNPVWLLSPISAPGSLSCWQYRPIPTADYLTNAVMKLRLHGFIQPLPIVHLYGLLFDKTQRHPWIYVTNFMANFCQNYICSTVFRRNFISETFCFWLVLSFLCKYKQLYLYDKPSCIFLRVGH